MTLKISLSHFVCLTFSLLSVQKLQAQFNSDINSAYPDVNREMSANHFIDPASGKINLAFDLFTISDDGLRFTAQLGHNSTGIKVGDTGGILGLSWGLNMPNYIIRKTVGLPDEITAGFPPHETGNLWTYNLHDDLSIDEDGIITEHEWPFTHPATLVGNSTLQRAMFISQGIADSQADQFEYDIPGHKGAFYIQDTNDDYVPHSISIEGQEYLYIPVLLLPYDDIQVYIKWAPPGYGIRIDGMAITDLNGYIYILDLVQVSATISSDWPHALESLHSKLLENHTGFFLTSIHDETGEKIIEIQYESYGTPVINWTEAMTPDQQTVNVPEFSPSNTGLITESRFDFYQTNLESSGSCGPVILLDQVIHRWTRHCSGVVLAKKIITKNEIFEFKYEDRQDYPNLKCLTRLSVTNQHSGKLVKKYILGYTYFGLNDAKRLLFTSLHEENEDQEQRELRRFEYNDSVLLPERNSLSIDHLGYYNGADNPHLVPQSYPDQNHLPTYADRDPSLSHTKALSLKRVILNQSRTIEFEYGLNKYRSVRKTALDTLKNYGGLRIERIIEQENQDTLSHITIHYTKNPGSLTSGEGDLEIDFSYFKREIAKFIPICFINPAFSGIISCTSDYCNWTAADVYASEPYFFSDLGPENNLVYEEVVIRQARYGRTEYSFSNENLPLDYSTHPYTPIIPSKKERFPVQVSCYSEANKKVMETENKFDTLTERKNSLSLFKIMAQTGSANVKLREYEIVSQPYQMTSRTTRYYDATDDQKFMEKKEYFSYNEKNPKLVSNTTTELSVNGHTHYITERRKYLLDYLETPDFDGAFGVALNHMNGVYISPKNALVETILLEGDSSLLSVISGSFITYGLFHNRILPEAIYTLYLENPMEENQFQSVTTSNGTHSPGHQWELTSRYTEYDQQHLPVTVLNPIGIPSTVIRDENTSGIIAMAENATRQDMYYLSFEKSHEDDCWSFQESNVQDDVSASIGTDIPEARAGSRYYRFSNDIIRLHLSSTGKFRLNFWSKNGNISVTLNGAPLTPDINYIPESAHGWRYHEYTFGCAPNDRIRISSADAVVDEITVAPVEAILSTTNYSDVLLPVTQSSDNGFVSRIVYDNWNLPYLRMADNGMIQTLSERTDFFPHSGFRMEKQATHIARQPDMTVADITQAVDPGNVLIHHSYQSGDGTPYQSVWLKESPAKKDKVQFYQRDSDGMESRQFLPFCAPSGNNGQFLTNAEALQYAFHQDIFGSEPNTYPFREIQFEKSPLKRPEKTGYTGEEWQLSTGLSSSYITKLNNTSDHVLLWKQNANDVVSAMSSNGVAYHPGNTLIKNESIDINGKISWEFVNEKGQRICIRHKVKMIGSPGNEYTTEYGNGEFDDDEIVLLPGQESHNVFLDTYFIYDAFGRLQYEIPALAIQKMNGNYTFGTTSSQTNYEIYNGFIDHFQYDRKGRIIQFKTADGLQKEYVWTLFNEIALSKETDLSSPSDQWYFIKYDHRKRIIQNGSFNSPLNRPALQALADTDDQFFESITSGQYSNTAFPVLPPDAEILNIFFYDSYHFDLNGYSINAFGATGKTASQRTRGFPTGSSTLLMDGTGSNRLTSVAYYDEYGKVNVAYDENINGGFDRMIHDYDFNHRLTKTTQLHKYAPASGTITVINEFLYDHFDRLLEEHQKIGSDQEVTIQKLKYNEAGQLVQKQIHLTDETNAGMQIIDYRYNKKGWLTKINNADLVDDGDNLESWDIFGQELIYYDTTHYWSRVLKAKPRYDGLIAAQKWKTNIAPDEEGFDSATMPGHSYVYRYDDLGQMTGAFYAGSSSLFIDHYNTNTHHWDEKATYNAGGHILALVRTRGADELNMPTAAPVTADLMSFDYYPNTHRVKSITDQGITTHFETYTHFTGTAGNNAGFAYDHTGKTTQDPYRNISFAYNSIGRLSGATHNSQSVTFIWDGLGRKWEKQVNNTAQQYINRFEYANGEIQSIHHSHGISRTVKLKTGGYDWVYDYFLTDYIGNVRAVITEEKSEVVHERVTMELALRLQEDETFENVSETDTDKPYLYPYDPENPDNTKVSELSSETGRIIGPAKILEIERGEKINVSTQYWYLEENESPLTSISEIISGALFSLTAVGQPVIPSTSETGLGLINNVSGEQFSAFSGFISDAFGNEDFSRPRAYLIYMFFDRQMMLRADLSGKIQVEQANELGTLSKKDIVADRDGYFYVFLTNRSETHVDFDNLTIEHWKPVVRMVRDYYPYGLVWQNPTATGNAPRLYDHTFQGKELQSGEFGNGYGLDILDFDHRMYDPVTGRWNCPDPAMQHYSPYLAMGNNPVSRIDPDGLWDDWWGEKQEDGSIQWHWDDHVRNAEDAKRLHNADYYAAPGHIAYNRESGWFMLDDNKGWHWLRGNTPKVQPLEARGAGDLASREASLPVQGGWVHELPASTWGTSTDLDLNNSEEWRKLGEQYNALGQLVEDTYFTAVTVVETVTTFGAATAVRSFAVNSLRTAAREVAEQSATQLARNAAKGGKAIVIGEGMGAVKTTAKTLQSQGINAKWYQAWSKNFPTDRLMTPAELSAAQTRNARWLNTKINQGYKIYDIGIDATRATRSPFYQLERSILQQRGYPTTIIPR